MYIYVDMCIYTYLLILHIAQCLLPMCCIVLSEVCQNDQTQCKIQDHGNEELHVNFLVRQYKKQYMCVYVYIYIIYILMIRMILTRIAQE